MGSIRNWIMGTSILSVLVAATVGFAFVLKASQGEDVTKYIGLDQKLNAQIPLDAKFKDEEGKDVKLAAYFGSKPVVLMLVFLQCRSSCTLEFEGAMKSFKAMKTDSIGKDYEVLTVSIHPKETPLLARNKKAEFLDEYNREGAEKGWHFLTGEMDQIKALADSVGFRFRYVPEKDQIVHPTGLIVLTPQGKVSKYWFGTEYSAPVLRKSLVAAAEQQVGTQSKEILFGCFQYDQATGKTRVNVMRALQVGGLATISVLLFSIFSMNRRRRDEIGDESKGGGISTH